MAKIDWSRHRLEETKLTREYWSNPKKGFDRAWHEKQAKLRAKKDRAIRDRAMAMIRANKKLPDDCPF